MTTAASPPKYISLAHYISATARIIASAPSNAPIERENEMAIITPHESFIKPYTTMRQFNEMLKATHPVTAFFIVNKEIAEAIMALTHNDPQRPLKPRGIEKWKKTILEGWFIRAPQGGIIMRDHDGRPFTVNMRHRMTGFLRAVVESGKPNLTIPMEIRFGDEPEVRHTIDDNGVRTTADQAHIREIGFGSSTKRMVAALRLVHDVLHLQPVSMGWDFPEYESYYGKFKDSMHWVCNFFHGAGRVYSKAPMLAAFIMLHAAEGEEAIEAFARQVRDGEELKKGSPALAVRNAAASTRVNLTSERYAFVRKVISAYHTAASGKETSRLMDAPKSTIRIAMKLEKKLSMEFPVAEDA